MKKVLLLILFFVVNFVLAQRQNTYRLFYNLPLDSSSNYIQNVLLADSANFEVKMVGKWRSKSQVKIPFFYPKEKPSIYSLDIESTHLFIDSLQKDSDLVQKMEITLCIRFRKNVKRMKAKKQYEKTVEYLRNGYDSLSNNYMQGFCKQKKLNTKREKYRVWKVYYSGTLFYLKTATKEKLDVTWVDERKHGQTIFISYILN